MYYSSLHNLKKAHNVIHNACLDAWSCQSRHYLQLFWLQRHCLSPPHCIPWPIAWKQWQGEQQCPPGSPLFIHYNKCKNQMHQTDTGLFWTQILQQRLPLLQRKQKRLLSRQNVGGNVTNRFIERATNLTWSEKGGNSSVGAWAWTRKIVRNWERHKLNTEQIVMPVNRWIN